MTDITFESLWLSKELLASIEAKGYKNPSPIQAWVIPLALNTDKDIVWQAQTGSGKTAAFWLPILDRIDKYSRDTQALILTPTRELAIQIADEIKSFSTKVDVNIVLLYGWQPIRGEMSALRSGPQIIVGTPGRVTDHLQKGRLNLDKIKYFVLDEADEMLNVGFKEEIEEILKFAPVEKKVFLFSATMPPFIQNIVKNYMRDYETVAIKKTELTNNNIAQHYYEAPRNHKFDVLCRILDVTPSFYGIIFCRTKAETDEVAAKLAQKWYRAEPIHGDIEQAMREKVLNRFKSRAISILVATDVAARWIDVADLTHVVNFELPDNAETYTHRIGRTGRAWKSGTAISIISPSDVRKLFYVERIIKTKIQKQTLPTGAQVVEYKKQRLFEDVGEILASPEGSDYEIISSELLANKDATKVVSALLKKFYNDDFKSESYSDLMAKGRSFERGDRPERSERSYASRDDGMIRLFVAKGKMDNITSVGNLLSFIARESGLGDLWAGKVDILTNFSYVDLPEETGHIVLDAFKAKNPSKPLVVRAKEKTFDGERRSGGGSRGFGNRNSSSGYRGSERGWYRGEKRFDRNSARKRDFRK